MINTRKKMAKIILNEKQFKEYLKYSINENRKEDYVKNIIKESIARRKAKA